jgi:hypothetical protein
MSRVKLAVAVALLGALMSASAVAIAGGGGGKASTRLSGFEEVPVVLTEGDGKFKARVNRGDPTTIDFTLRWEDLEGGNVTQAHIHLGQELVNGGVAAWLCGNPPTNPPAGTPACPPGPDGEVTGTITPAHVTGIPTQSLNPGDVEAVVRAMRRGLTYANVHTAQSPAGEIRGQIDGNGKHRGDDDHRGDRGDYDRGGDGDRRGGDDRGGRGGDHDDDPE